MVMTRPLSILDLAPIPAGASARQALQAAVDLAVLAERLGYQRVWYAQLCWLPWSSAPRTGAVPVAICCGKRRLCEGLRGRSRCCQGEPTMFTTICHALRRRAGASLRAARQRLLAFLKPATATPVGGALGDLARTKAESVTENALLRQQLGVLRRQVKRPVFTPADRLRLVLLARLARGWQAALLYWLRNSFRRMDAGKTPRSMPGQRDGRIAWRTEPQAVPSGGRVVVLPGSGACSHDALPGSASASSMASTRSAPWSAGGRHRAPSPWRPGWPPMPSRCSVGCTTPIAAPPETPYGPHGGEPLPRRAYARAERCGGGGTRPDESTGGDRPTAGARRVAARRGPRAADLAAKSCRPSGDSARSAGAIPDSPWMSRVAITRDQGARMSQTARTT